jgi:hypothetical protein
MPSPAYCLPGTLTESLKGWVQPLGRGGAAAEGAERRAFASYAYGVRARVINIQAVHNTGKMRKEKGKRKEGEGRLAQQTEYCASSPALPAGIATSSVAAAEPRIESFATEDIGHAREALGV